jgi:hypothetical protein
MSTPNIPPDQFSSIGRSLEASRCELKLPPSDYLPPRSALADTLGVFGAAAAWLLRTESFELALITGLLGFGFFGALAASFIREFAGTRGYDLPAIGIIVPALIRGVGAAILVFLLAKGGTAILTRGDARPNAYAIFFACFVAAVFSEDVWSWARNRQRNQLPNAQNTGKSSPDAPAEPAATAPAETPPKKEPGERPADVASTEASKPTPAVSAIPDGGWSRYATWLRRRGTD